MIEAMIIDFMLSFRLEWK